MGWLRLAGSLKLYVSFAKEPYKTDCILQKRRIILRSLLIVGTSQLHLSVSVFVITCMYALRITVLHCVALCCTVLHCVALLYGMLRCNAVRCSVLQCVAVCCSVLQCDAVCCISRYVPITHILAHTVKGSSPIMYSQSHVGWHFRKLKARTSLLPRFSEKRRWSFELWALKQHSKMSPLKCDHWWDRV